MAVIVFAGCGVEAYLYTCPFMRPVYNGVFYIYRLYLFVFCLPVCNAGLCYFVLFFLWNHSFILITTDKWAMTLALRSCFNDKLLFFLVMYLH